MATPSPQKLPWFLRTLTAVKTSVYFYMSPRCFSHTLHDRRLRELRTTLRHTNLKLSGKQGQTTRITLRVFNCELHSNSAIPNNRKLQYYFILPSHNRSLRTGTQIQASRTGPSAVFSTSEATWITRWIKYDRDDLCVNKSQFVPVISEPTCTWSNMSYCLWHIC